MTQQKESRIHLRGFGSMKLKDPQRLAELTSLAGRTSHANGKAHKWSGEEAAEAGRKGGLARAAKYRQASQGEQQ